MTAVQSIRLAALSAALFTFHCSSDATPEGGAGAGGFAPANGGTYGSGGALGAGGTSGTGGATSTGGFTPGSGGAVSAAGGVSPASGGSVSGSGGTATTGGSSGSGGGGATRPVDTVGNEQRAPGFVDLSTNRLGTYYMPGSLHQHLFRARLYEAPAGGVTIAKFVQDFIDGKVTNVGP
jgi:hypothetical protein